MKDLPSVLLLFLLACAVQIPAVADTNLMSLDAQTAANGTPPPQEGWQGSVSLGYQSTGGNTDTTSFNGSATAAYRRGKWQHSVSAQALGASDTGVTTASSQELKGQSNYNLTDSGYLFGYLDALSDRFSGYDRRYTELVGYGYRLVNTQTQSLALEFGAGARQTRFTDDTHEHEPVERLALDYLWKFTDTSNFSELLSTEHGSDNTYTQSVTALTANLVGHLALSVSYTIKHNSTVLPGFKNTDTATAISLVYTF